MDKIISYTEDIKKFISGTQYSGKNIQTTDGKIAYITKTGIAKPYKSADSLSNANNCTDKLIQIGSAWGDLGIPIGSLMVNGQSCGNETKYVQSKPPDVNFDWKYYSDSNPSLQLTTEQQAYDHWTTTGIHEGLLPNPTILSNMSNVGNLGYIDINTTLTPIANGTYSGEYTQFNTSNVTGSAMKNCIVPQATIKYGDQLFLKINDEYGANKMNLIFGAEKTNLIIQPLDDTLDKQPIKYGDNVMIFDYSSNTVASLTTDSLSTKGAKSGDYLFFGPTPINYFTITVPPGTSYKNNTKIKYGDPFSIIFNNLTLWSEQQGINYVGNDISHTIQTPKDCKSSCANTNGCAGIVSDSQNNCWLKSKFDSASSVSELNTYMTPDASKLSVNTTNYSWNQLGNRDHPGNDMSSYNNLSINACKNKCEDTYGCAGIVTDDSGKNLCWLKNKFGTGKDNKDRNTFIMSKSTVKLPPFKTGYDENIMFGYSGIGGAMQFASLDISSGKNIFTFESATNPPYVAQCDLNALKQQCDQDTNCNGIIHSTKDNSWQKISRNSTADMYQITDTPPNMYVKNLSSNNNSTTFIDSETFAHYPVNNVKWTRRLNTAYPNPDGTSVVGTYQNISDNDCKEKCVETQNCAGITNYAYDSGGSSCLLMSTSENGFNYVMEGQHATSYALDKSSNNINVDFSGIQTKQQEYNQGNQMAEKYGEQILNSSPHITPYINQTKNMYNQLNTKTNEYKTVLKKIKKKKETYNGTYNQQKEDLDVLQNENKINVLLWGLSSIIVISMVVILKNKQ